MSLFNAPDLHLRLRGVAHLMATDALSIKFAQRYDLAEAAEAQQDVIADSFLGKLEVVP